MPRLRLTVNEHVHEVDVPDGIPLLWVLRDDLRLVGTKYGCGAGVCGACTVFADGEPVRSCMLSASAASARRITTLEGLGGVGVEAVRQAWIEEDVSQCGYCQGGQILAACALLARTPSPTDAEIDAAMARHICRCGTYQRIRRAIHRAAAAGAAGASR